MRIADSMSICYVEEDADGRGTWEMKQPVQVLKHGSKDFRRSLSTMYVPRVLEYSSAVGLPPSILLVDLNKLN